METHCQGETQSDSSVLSFGTDPVSPKRGMLGETPLYAQGRLGLSEHSLVLASLAGVFSKSLLLVEPVPSSPQPSVP